VVFAVMALAMGLLAPASSWAAAAFPQNTVLDSYEPNNDHFAGPVRSTSKLSVGVPYVAEVQGTFSYYEKQNLKPSTLEAPWTVLCGSPLADPMFLSSHVKKKFQKRVDLDPEFIFAIPRKQAGDCSGSYPQHWINFQLSTTTGSAGYGHVEPLGPYPTAPTADHRYLYPLLGAGEKARFRLVDRPRTDDNYGELHITIRAATAEECAGDFARFGLADAASCSTAPSAG
jgi:hypothetical protein